MPHRTSPNNDDRIVLLNARGTARLLSISIRQVWRADAAGKLPKVSDRRVYTIRHRGYRCVHRFPPPYQRKENPMTENAYRAAREYAELGLRVMPLHAASNGTCSCDRPACSEPGLHPRSEPGVEEGSSSERTLRSWFGNDTPSNLAIVTGREAGVLVLGIDEIGEESI